MLGCLRGREPVSPLTAGPVTAAWLRSTESRKPRATDCAGREPRRDLHTPTVAGSPEEVLYY